MWRRPGNVTLARLLLLATVFIWGVTFSLVKSALSDISPLLFNLLRMALATAVLVFVNYRQIRGVSRQGLLAGLVAGFFLAAGYQFQTAGLARTTPTKSAFITGLVVVIVPLLTLFPKIRPVHTSAPRATTLLGAVLSFTGLLLLTTPSGVTFASLTSTISLGDFFTLLCALAFAGHLLALAHFSQGMPTRQLATLQVSFATLFMLLTIPLSGRLYLQVTFRLIFALGVTSIVATAAAFTIQSWSQQHLTPNHTAIIFTLEPVIALVVAMIFLGERLSRRSGLGSALILAGIGFVEFFPPPAVST